MCYTLSSLSLMRLTVALEYGAVRGEPAAQFLENLDLEACAREFSAASATRPYVIVSISPELHEEEVESEEEEEEHQEGSSSDESLHGLEGELSRFMMEDDDDGW